MVPLSLPRSHIIHDRKPPHILHGLLFPYPKPWLPNHNSNLALIVHRLREPRVRKDILASRNNGSKPLSEDHRMRGRIDFIRAVETRAVEFLRVLGIVFAHAEDVAACEGGEDLHGREGEGMACGDDVGFADFDDLVHVF